MINRALRIDIGQTIKVRHKDSETEGEVLNISYGGILLNSDLGPELGDEITIIHEHAGELQGSVVRITPEGFAMQFDEGELSAIFALNSITSDMLHKEFPQEENSDKNKDEQE